MCTNFLIPKDDAREFVVSGRTMDFGEKMNTTLCMVPRGHAFPMPFIHPENHYAWKNKYGFVGMTIAFHAFGKEISAAYYGDGMNEKGVSIGALWLPGTTYPHASSTTKNVFLGDVPSLVLGLAADVNEAREILESVNVIDFPILEALNYPPLHFPICDANGDCIVVEFIDGKMNISPNTNGVLTNAPTYDWHLTNLTNYENCTVVNNPQKHWGQEINGSGMLGVPGDATPPSRFVRITKMLDTIYKPTSTQDAVMLAQQLVQTVFVPYGTIVGPHNNLADFTQWFVVRDHRNLVYYYATGFNSTLQCVDLKELNFDAAHRQCIDIVTEKWYDDRTAELNAA